MAGQIVVAVESSDRSSIEAILGATTWVELRKDRWIATYKTATEDDARQRVAELRRKQYSAVSGPPDEQRAGAWNKWNSPIAINEAIDVCFPWAFSDAEIVIEIDPGAGFGRGDHPSTRLLLDQLTARISGSESVLDVGCGSGILAIAAVQLGAESALGIDVNEEGLVAAAANAFESAQLLSAGWSCAGSVRHGSSLAGSSLIARAKSAATESCSRSLCRW